MFVQDQALTTCTLRLYQPDFIAGTMTIYPLRLRIIHGSARHLRPAELPPCLISENFYANDIAYSDFAAATTADY